MKTYNGSVCMGYTNIQFLRQDGPVTIRRRSQFQALSQINCMLTGEISSLCCGLPAFVIITLDLMLLSFVFFFHLKNCITWPHMHV